MIENVNLYGSGLKKVGIDYSMSSPAICLSYNEEVSWQTCKIFYLTDKKKYLGHFAEDKIILKRRLRLDISTRKVSFTFELDNGTFESGY